MVWIYTLLKCVLYWYLFDELTDFSAQEQDKRFLIWGPACLWTESHHHKRCFQISTSSNQNKAIPKTRRCPYIVYGTGRSQFYAIRDSALIDKKKPKENSKRCAQTVTNINNKEKTYFVKFFFSFLLWPAHKSHTQNAETSAPGLNRDDTIISRERNTWRHWRRVVQVRNWNWSWATKWDSESESASKLESDPDSELWNTFRI